MKSIQGFAGYSQDQKIDRIVRNYEEQILKLKADQNKSLAAEKSISIPKNQERTNALAHENRLVLDELMLRQDSIENARNCSA